MLSEHVQNFTKDAVGITHRVDGLRRALHGDFPVVDVALVGQIDGASCGRLGVDVAQLLRG